MAEGEFPKSDGDILYASEVNRLHSKVIGNVIQYGYHNTSGIAYSVIGGSILYDATDPIEEFFQISTAVRKEGGRNIIRLSVSGEALDMDLPVKTLPLGNSSEIIFFNECLTSGAITASGGNIGSAVVFFLEGIGSYNSANINYNDFTVIGH